MSKSYQRSSYIVAPYSFEAAKNPDTEQLRALSGLETIYMFHLGPLQADEQFLLPFLGDTLIDGLTVDYPGTPEGTFALSLIDPAGVEIRHLIFDVATNGEMFGDVWIFNLPGSLPVPEGWQVGFEASVNIELFTLHMKPCLLFPAMQGSKV